MYMNTELKMNGHDMFRRNYWPCVCVALIFTILCEGGGGVSVGQNIDVTDVADSFDGILSIPAGIATMAMGIIGIVSIVAVMFGFFISNVIEVGKDRFFIQNRVSAPGAGTILDGFRSGYYMNLVKTMFFKDLFTFLWTLLLIIPGIVKSYEYMMVPYILADNPGMDRKDAFALSKQMMDGEKANAFLLRLSFIGWDLLAILTCGILYVFYVNPYIQATYAELYQYNKEKSYQNGWIS